MPFDGPAIPYEIRTNKFVSRRLFVDALRHVDRAYPLSGAVYIGMGAISLEDHKIMYREFGIEKLISFDTCARIVRRQKFNRPLANVLCVKASSSEILGELDHYLTDAGFGLESRLVVWLDFTKVEDLANQLEDVQIALSQMVEGDVLRITMNAHSLNWAAGRDDIPVEETLSRRHQAFDEAAGDLQPVAASDQDFTKLRFPLVVLETLRNAVFQANIGSQQLEAVPIQIESYADGQTMISATCVVLPVGGFEAFAGASDITRWSFWRNDWLLPVSLDLPTITLRERLMFDQWSEQDFPEIVTVECPFEEDEALETYRKYHEIARYVPHFHHVVY